jgi:hypothetical protein
VLDSAKPGSKIIVPMGPPRGDNPRYYVNCPPPDSDPKIKVARDGSVPTNTGTIPVKYFDNCPGSAGRPVTKAAKKKPAGKTARGKKQA